MTAAFIIVSLCPSGTVAQRQMEGLGRGVVAVSQADGKVWVGWRLLGTDAESIAFNLYRATEGGKPVRLNDRPLIETTNFVDAKAEVSKSHSYFVRPVLKGQSGRRAPRSRCAADTPARQYLCVPLQTPEGYAPNDASVGDLDGDGEYEMVLHQAGRGRDNGQGGLDDRADPRSLQARRHAAVAHQPRPEHPRGRALHAVHGLRPRRRRARRSRLQDGRRHD